MTNQDSNRPISKPITHGADGVPGSGVPKRPARSTSPLAPRAPTSPAQPPDRKAAPAGVKKWNWGRIALIALFWLVAATALAGLGTAAWEGHRASTPLAPLSIGLFVLGLLVALVGVRRLEASTVALVLMLVLAVEVSVAALFFGNVQPPAFLLLGRETGFWANALCLADLALLALLGLPMLPGVFLRVAAGAVFVYASLGFVVGIVEGTALETTLLGAGFLARLPSFYLQPAFLALNVVLPVALVFLAFGAVRAIQHDSRALLAVSLFLLGLTTLPLAVGFVLMTRFHIPNLTWLLGRPRARGQMEVAYESPWAHGPDGTLSHKILVRTPGYTPAMTPTWTFKGSLGRPPARGEDTVVYLSVKQARSGADVVNLTKSDLEVREDDQAVREFRLDRLLTVQHGANAVVLVLDQSASMDRAMDDLKKAATEFVARLDPSFKLSLVTFAGTVHERVPFPADRSNNRDRVKKEIDDLSCLPWTAVIDGIHSGLTQLSALEAKRKMVVVFTDGGDNSSKHSAGEIFEMAQKTGIPIHAIGLGEELKKGGEELLKEAAAKTGGSYRYTRDASDLGQAFGSVFDVIACSYTLTYARPPTAPPTLEIEKPAEGEVLRSGFEIVARASGGPLDHIQVSVDGNPVKECPASPCSFAANPGELGEGPHTITAVAFGKDGDKVEVKRSIKIEAPPPVVEILSPSPGALIYSSETAIVRVRGRKIQRVAATLDGQPVALAARELADCPGGGGGGSGDPADSGSCWALAIEPGKVAAGIHTLKIRAESSGGGVGEGSVSFKVTIPSARVSLGDFKPGIAVAGVRSFGINVATEPRSLAIAGVEAWIDGKPLGHLPGPPWSVAIEGPKLSEGAHLLRLRATTVVGVHPSGAGPSRPRGRSTPSRSTRRRCPPAGPWSRRGRSGRTGRSRRPRWPCCW
ncbi:MAG: VWA domain-containing protein [Candidatus Riflebacteria bacterium]|nr:VWA domain-containing protein [Candidatus Riflebacteria bacterium]